MRADSCPLLCFAGEFDFPDSNSLDLSGEGINWGPPWPGWREGMGWHGSLRGPDPGQVGAFVAVGSIVGPFPSL